MRKKQDYTTYINLSCALPTRGRKTIGEVVLINYSAGKEPVLLGTYKMTLKRQERRK